MAKKSNSNRPTFTDQEALRLPQPGPPRQARGDRHQADGDAARSVAGLFARRRGPGAGHRRRSGQGLRLHDQGQLRRRHHQRHRHPRPRQPRRARGQAGDGRQGGAVQALRRHRFHRSRGVLRGPRRDHQLRQAARRRLGRHQPRGHQGAGVLHHRAAAARAARHSGVPRRPARHRDHLRPPACSTRSTSPAARSKTPSSSATAPAPPASPAWSCSKPSASSTRT